MTAEHTGSGGHDRAGAPQPVVPNGEVAGARPRRDAQATRDAIMLAARRQFARRPYSDITVKEIAEAAGVSPPLVIKYFGSKERLFARISAFEDGIDDLLDAPVPQLGRHMVRYLLEGRQLPRGDPIVRIAFASIQGGLADRIRTNFKARVVHRLAARLDGEQREIRAELALAQLIGLGIALGVLRADAALAADTEDLVDRYAPGVQRLLDPRVDGG